MNENCSEKIISEDYIDFISDYELASKKELDNMNICFLQIDSLYASLYIPKQLVPRNVLDEYGYKVFVRLFGLLDLSSLEETGVTRIRNIPYLDLRGEGVLIGIIDTGIDYTHKAFLKTDGTSRIVSIWDQSIQGDNPPDGLFYGTEYTMEQINIALQSSDPSSVVPSFDEIGHGTFLAGIAAGNIDLDNDFSGVAPNAELVVVKLKPAKQNLRSLYLLPEDAVCYQENDIMLGVKYLLEVAARLNRPISICIGLGTSQGAHDTNGLLSMYLSSVTQMDGVAVVIAAGNEGNSKHHFESLMRIGTNIETVDLIVGPAEQGFTIEIWGNPPAAYTTGVAAMLLEWGIVRGNIKYMNGSDVKNLLIRGAKRDLTKTYPNREWGYGMLDVFGAFENLRGS